ncbi:MAG: carboxypeptidase-like regulatory domain-containing protein [Thermoplasmatota archaeon]
MRALPLFVVAMAVLAGCSSKPAATQGPDCSDPHNAQDPLCTHSSTGSIRGVVTDAAIHPLAGVQVTVPLQGKPTLVANTTAAGSFGFSGLAPGTYFVQAVKPGFSPTQTSVDVVAGEIPKVTKIVMAADMTTKPYYEVYHYQGFIECSVNFVVNGLAACSVPNAGCGQAPGAPCNVTDDRFLVSYVPSGTLAWAQSEMVWQSTQQTGNQMDLLYTDFSNNNIDNYEDHTGSSPDVVHANASVLAKHVSASNPLTIRVFAGYVNGTGPGAAPQDCCGAGGAVEQQFDIYTVLFYGFTPPPGYLFIQDGEPHPPQ